MESLKDVLIREGKVVMPLIGVSMLPMLRSGKDSVVVLAKKEKLKENDVALYIRSSDKAYILHRVIEVMKDGYIIRGDNCYANEIVKEDEVIGVLSGYFRGERFISVDEPSYLRYVQRRRKNYPLRKKLQKGKNFLRKLWNKLKGKR